MQPLPGVRRCLREGVRDPARTWDFGKVDSEAERELAAAFDVMSIPTLMALRERVIVYLERGVLPASERDEPIGTVRGLDMERMQRRIAGTHVAP